MLKPELLRCVRACTRTHSHETRIGCPSTLIPLTPLRIARSAIVDFGFEHPSEVQHEAIPNCLLGMDVLCQAKCVRVRS